MTSRHKERLTAFLLLLPSVILIGIFVYGFIGRTMYVSMSNWRGTGPDYTFVGLKNYRTLFTLHRFRVGVRNNVVFTVIFIPACIVLGFFMAFLLDQKVKFEAFFRKYIPISHGPLLCDHRYCLGMDIQPPGGLKHTSGQNGAGFFAVRVDH